MRELVWKRSIASIGEEREREKVREKVSATPYNSNSIHSIVIGKRWSNKRGRGAWRRCQ